MKTIKSLCSLLFILLLTFPLSFLHSQNPSPNVIVIIADDMGWSQVSTGLTNLNNPSDFYETPTLETLATEGIAFPHAYVNGANCAPTRSAILSGQYAARPTNNIFAVDNLNRGGNSTLLVGPSNGLPSGIDEIPASAITLAETMKTAGYTTVHLGKYHVGENESTNVSNNAATDQGFDFNYGGGTKGAPGSYFSSQSGGVWTFHSNIGPELDVYADPYTLAESMALAGDSSLEGTAKHVTDAMADAAIDFMNTNTSNPFFMHFSNFAIHGPFDQSNARPDLYAKYDAKTPSTMGHNNKGQAAIAEGMDQTIGRLIDYLKTTVDTRNPGHMLSENTLVYFISDNGGAISTDDNGPLRGKKGDFYEGGIRSVTIAWSEATWLANKGTINSTPILAFDLYPTLVEAAGGTLPSGYDIDGESQWQMLTNGTSMTRTGLFWHFPGYIRDQKPVSVIRKGDYKLIHNYETASYELYNLITDISETTNLLSGSPDTATLVIANDMSTDLQNHLVTTSAPLPTYRSDGTTVPLPYIISTSSSPNSTAGCQAASGYEAYWDFDTASNANDASGNGHDPTPMNGTLTYDTVDFKEGDQSAVFDGTVDINYSTSTFLSPVTSARSVSVWIKPTSLTGIQEIFDEGGNTVGIAMRLNGSNLESIVRESLTVSTSLSTAYPTDGDWHHVALVFDGANTTHALYIDGVLATSNTSAASSIGSHNETGGGIGGVIGSYDSFANAADSYFIGKMDAFSVYDSVLTITEIQDASCFVVQNSSAACQAVSGYEAYWDFDIASEANDASGNSHDPASINGTLTYDTVDFKEGDQSVVFDGTVNIQYSSGSFMTTGTSTRSAMAWVKPISLTGIQNIFDEGGRLVGIGMRLNGANLESIVRDTETTSSLLSFAFPNDGDWHHVAIVYDGGSTSHKLYLDGAEVASDSSAPSIVGAHTGLGGIAGKISGTDSFNNSAVSNFTGKMDAFAFYNNTLTALEVEDSACISSQVIADAGLDVTICDGDSTILTASGGTTYLWSTGETTASIMVNPSVTTTYMVTVSNSSSSDNDDVIVTVNTSPVADAGSDVTITEGDSTTLTASGGGAYLWSTGETIASIIVSPTVTTTYTVTVTQGGCSDSADVIITVNPLGGGCTYTVINTEGFETGWGIWNDGGSDAVRDSNASYATTGTYSMRLRDNTSTSVGTTDNLDLVIYDEITIDFGYYCRSMDNSNEDFWLQISTDGGSNFTTVEEWNRDDEFVNDQFYTDQVIIAGPFTATTQFRFRADASGNQDWVYIDDIVINGCTTSGSSRIISNDKTNNELLSVNESVVRKEANMVLYPNPFLDKFSISMRDTYKNIKVELINVLGQQLFSKEFKKNEVIEVGTQGLPQGQYLIKINIDNKITFKRVVKK
ncbi:hypothetical protein A8C32_05680 [Flavivirga aquatica]|uniref:LamG-like jellyroll fold domain-containing protein n=1 Tax=Flavivirga aquatica TaxID=1849968 RepID=A0A1E5SHS4_9FLAO|nr:sulfatase-like hydrolase/transferase [Flavivirga aquatica]OEJ98687.1 hypothetical protein A8C32_05680 [Flavivirga aquatica]